MITTAELEQALNSGRGQEKLADIVGPGSRKPGKKSRKKGEQGGVLPMVVHGNPNRGKDE